MNKSPVIIIPFYKLRYFELVLESLAAQTDHEFEVFIGDDASPEDPRPIIKKFEVKLKITYQRFSENLGGHSLVQHWSRCVNATSAEWIWLFSDDDLASPDCLASFKQALRETDSKFDVYRFNTRMIDGAGAEISQSPRHPRIQSSSEFALAKIGGKNRSYAVEYIFRRSVFAQARGFVEFPLAWFSDDASWIVFGEQTGIYTMDHGEISWRQSGINLSSSDSKYMSAKLRAFGVYLLWIKARFPDPLFMKQFIAAMRPRFVDQLPFWGGKPELISGLKFWIFFSRFTGNVNISFLRYTLRLPSVRHLWRQGNLKCAQVFSKKAKSV